MDQADWKLRVFYQYQIAKIARHAGDRTHPAARKRLNFLLNEYIDKLLAMPRLNERMQGVETKMLPTCPVSEKRVARARKPASKSWLEQHALKEISSRPVSNSGQICDRRKVELVEQLAQLQKLRERVHAAAAARNHIRQARRAYRTRCG